MVEKKGLSKLMGLVMDATMAQSTWMVELTASQTALWRSKEHLKAVTMETEIPTVHLKETEKEHGILKAAAMAETMSLRESCSGSRQNSVTSTRSVASDGSQLATVSSAPRR
mgnify:CR=1 FL=1